ncbi:MAG: HAD family hydrolase [Clostridia bacterium]|nr:HAD family hydrolase [Clostridia bacterium]
MINNIKAVLFDLDGTTVNTIEDLCDAVKHSMNENGYPTYTVDEYKMMVGNGMRKLLERALPKSVCNDAKVVDELFLGFAKYYTANCCNKSAPYDGIVELISRLKQAGIKIATVTNKGESSAQRVVSKLFSDSFDFVIGQSDKYPTKPDPTTAFIAMDKLGVKPQECVFVGDSGVDMITAKNCGAYPVGVSWGFRTEQELWDNGAKHVISHPLQLLEIIF